MSLTKIVLATDGSPQAERAARMAFTLSSKIGAELHVLCVGQVPGAYIPAETEILDYEFWEEMRQFAREEASGRLQEEVRKIEDEGGKVERSHVAVGRADAEIVRLAEEIGAQMVVVGSRGLGPLRRAVLGSVSNSVVRHAHGSVLVVRANDEDTHLPGRVLLALDGSNEAEAAERMALEICASTGSEIHILSVVETEAYRPYPGPEFREGWEVDLERAKHHARTFLDEHAQRIKAEGVKVGETKLALGDADREIVRFAEGMHADLIVVGSRGLGGVRRALIGSVSDSVVRHAHCPVLVVREGSKHKSVANHSTEASATP